MITPSLECGLLSPARSPAGVLLLSLSFGGVRLGEVVLDIDSIFCAEPFCAFPGDDFAGADRDARFGGLELSLSFSFDGVRLGGLDLDPVGCLAGKPEVFVTRMGDGRADAEAAEFERDGGGVGAAGGLAHFAGDSRAGVETADRLDPDPTRFPKALSVLFEDNDLAPSAVFGLALCSSFTLRGVRCDDTARRMC